MNKSYFPRINVLSVFMFMFFLFCAVNSSAGNDSFNEALKAATDGNVKQIINTCGTIVTEEENFTLLAKAYTLLAIAYTLDAEESAIDSCSGLIDLLPDEISKTPALPIMRLLAGEIKINDLDKKFANFPQDWQAIAAVSMYLTGVRNKAKIKELYSYCKKYQDSIIGLPNHDWALVWNSRLVKWQKWMQSGKGEKDKLEKLIAENGATVKTKIKLTEEDQTKRFTEVTDVIKLYLQNNASKAREEAVKAKTAYSGTYAPLYVILDYLSGNNMVTQEKIFEITKTKAATWALATVAMFAKSLSDSDKPDKQQLYYYIDNYDGNYKILKSKPGIAVWKANVDRWRKWVDSDFKADAVFGLEPLLIDKSKNGEKIVAKADIKDITLTELEVFEEGRSEKYKDRPKPASMDFDDDVFNKYLAKLPEKLRVTEKLRYTTVKNIKHYLVRIMERTPYPKGLKTKRGKKTGVVYMANINILRLKKSRKSKKGKSYKWSDLKFEQYPAFMEYYAKRRLKMTGAANVTRKKMKKDAAMEYLGLAILCDWFGRYEDALKYAKYAVKLSPINKDRISRMMLE